MTREDATTWAGWFKALGDPTRILILHLLATEARPMTTGEVVEAMDVGQSTVSHHLQILGETCFVHVERSGTQSWWRINERCMASFPSAAELIMGRLPQSPRGTTRSDCCRPDLLMSTPDPVLEPLRRGRPIASSAGAACDGCSAGSLRGRQLRRPRRSP